jgi:hypothetical protein
VRTIEEIRSAIADTAIKATKAGLDHRTAYYRERLLDTALSDAEGHMSARALAHETLGICHRYEAILIELVRELDAAEAEQ